MKFARWCVTCYICICFFEEKRTNKGLFITKNVIFAPSVILCNRFLAAIGGNIYFCIVRTDNPIVERFKKIKKMKKLILMSIMAVVCLMTASAQKTVVSQSNQNIYNAVEQMPEFPGGMPAMMEFLQTNIKYPKDAIKQNVGGRVMVMFVVETDGSLSNVRVARKVFPSLDAEAVRVVKAMPKWKPGKEKGRAVRVNFTMPVVFSIKK